MQRYLFSILLFFEYQMFLLLKVSSPYIFLTSSASRCLTASPLDVVHFTFLLCSSCSSSPAANKDGDLDYNLLSQWAACIVYPTGKSNRVYAQSKAWLPESYTAHLVSSEIRQLLGEELQQYSGNTYLAGVHTKVPVLGAAISGTQDTLIILDADLASSAGSQKQLLDFTYSAQQRAQPLVWGLFSPCQSLMFLDSAISSS